MLEDSLFKRNPDAQKRRDEILSELNNDEFNSEGLTFEFNTEAGIEYNRSGELGLEEYDNPDAKVLQKSLLGTVGMFLVMKGIEHVGNEYGPKFLEKIVKAIEKKMDPSMNIWIPGFGKVSASNLINRWRNIGKVLWPKANWGKLDNIELNENSTEIINNFIAGIDTIEGLSGDQKNEIKSKASIHMIMKQDEEADALQFVKLSPESIEKINNELKKIESLGLSEDKMDKAKEEIAYMKLLKLIEQ